jgi:hypothetical protein
LDSPKSKYVELSEELSSILESQKRRAWHDTVTFDESWIYFRPDHELVWPQLGEEVPETERSTIQSEKMMITIVRELKSKSEKLNWSEVSYFFPSKTQHQVNERWQKVLNPNLMKGSWTGTEDQVVVASVAQHGLRDWGELATNLPGRIGKQCRERFHNHLSPLVVKSNWTEDEDRTR